MHQLILDTLDPDLKAAFQADPGPVALQTALQLQMIRLLRPATISGPLKALLDVKIPEVDAKAVEQHERVSKRSKERRGH